MSIGVAERDRYSPSDSHVYFVRKPVRESRRAPSLDYVPGQLFEEICVTTFETDCVHQSVLSAQFETATEFGSLLRANTPVSRMMTTYTRRGPGQSYLKSVLAERINSLIEHKDLNLEINPLKVGLAICPTYVPNLIAAAQVYEQMCNSIQDETGTLPDDLPKSVSPESAAANPDVQNIIAPRLTMLMEIANSFLLTIMDSLDSVPYGIRWICKQIRSLTKVRELCGLVVLGKLTVYRTLEKVSGGHRLCHMLSHWRVLLPSIHQPRHRYSSGVHAHR